MTKILLTFFWGWLFGVPLYGQNAWMPDATGYRYLTRGDNLSQWEASPGTRLSLDTTKFLTGASSLKWTIPPNSGAATLELRLFDVDLSDQIVYMSCSQNARAAEVWAYLMVGPGKGVALAQPIPYDRSGWYLPAAEWHQTGRHTLYGDFGGATPADLKHVKSLLFVAAKANVEQIFWIAEIKYTRPRGPACIIHFNAFRRTADSLLVPWLIERGYPANLDFVYEWAKTEKREHRNQGGIWVRYIGLTRIAELARSYNWSTTHHGVFYKDLPTLTLEQRQQLYALQPYVESGFTVNWCFSVPHDAMTPEIMGEVKALKSFEVLRRQFDWSGNELPIDNPQSLRFYRPTSAAASPNLIGRPRSLAAMKVEIFEKFYKRQGLLVLDFGDIVAVSSPTYTELEITLLSDAQALIQYADSLGFSFLTFRDLFQSDPSYRAQLSINHDYARVATGSSHSVPVLKNDLVPLGKSIWIAEVSKPQHGRAVITADQKNVVYISDSNFSGIDRFNYVVTDGSISAAASVFVNVLRDTSVDGNAPARGFALHQNYPNPFNPVTMIKYTLPAPSRVRLEIFNVNGEAVATLVDGAQAAGTSTIYFNAQKLGNGIYFYRLLTGAFTETRKMMVMK